MGGGEWKPSEKAHSRQPGARKMRSLTLALFRKIGYVENVAFRINRGMRCKESEALDALDTHYRRRPRARRGRVRGGASAVWRSAAVVIPLKDDLYAGLVIEEDDPPATAAAIQRALGEG